MFVDIVTSLLQSFSPTLFSMWYNAKLFGILGLVFGGTFALTFVVLGRFLPNGRVPTWLAAVVGGIGAPLGGTLLFTSINSIYASPLVSAVMAVVGTVIGTGIGFAANRGVLVTGGANGELTAGGTEIGAGEGNPL